MIVYLVNICLILFYASCFLRYKPTQCSKKLFCIMATINWLIIAGLRHPALGPDTIGYYNHFGLVKYMSWKSIIKNFYKIIFKDSLGKDPGYNMFEKLAHIFTDNSQVYLIIIAFTFIIPLGIWIYNYSSEPLISFILFSCLFYYAFVIVTLRQSIAASLAVFIGYKFVKERKFIKFFVIILIAATIHKSAIGFFPFYFIAYKKITKRYLILTSFMFPCIFIFKKHLMFVLTNLLNYKEYNNQMGRTGPWTFAGFLLLLVILTFWRNKKIIKNNLYSLHYINAVIISFLLIPIVFIHPATMRGVSYYSVFLMLLLPEIVYSFNKRERRFIYFLVTFIMIILFAKNNPQYLFYWQ